MEEWGGFEWPSRVQVDGVDLVEAAVDASGLEQEAVVWAGRHGEASPRLALQVLQQVEPWGQSSTSSLSLFHNLCCSYF